MAYSQDDYMTYRIQKAEEAYSDSLLLFDNGRCNSAVNRLYYACFYIVSALLTSKGLQAGTHNGTKVLFFREFVKPGIIQPQFGTLYSNLFDWRQEADYADFIDFDIATLKELMVETRNFIDVVKSLTIHSNRQNAES